MKQKSWELLASDENVEAEMGMWLDLSQGQLREAVKSEPRLVGPAKVQCQL